jgi:predicted dehydrogenase
MTGPRAVIIGAGAGVFHFHRRALEAVGAEIAGVHDVDHDRALRVASSIGCPAFADTAALLALGADLAVVLAPHPFHAELAIAALRCGHHVLVEKPIADEVAAADRMVAEAGHAGRLLAVSLQHRARQEVREAVRLVRSGALGELQHVSLLATWPRPAAYFGLAPWRGTWRGEGGGILINQGQHDLDLLCCLAGGAPSRVAGWTRARLHAIETEDTADALAEWPNGAAGSIHISTAEADEPQRIEVVGTRGRLRLLPGRLEVHRNEVDFREYAASETNAFAPPAVAGQPAIEAVTSPGAGQEAIYRNLLEALAGREPLIADGRSATWPLEVANAIILSSATGAEVPLPLDRAAYSALLASRRD